MSYTSILGEGLFGNGPLADAMERALDLCILEENEEDSSLWDDDDE